ncbi:MAG: thermonuclease family protein [Candidatus Aenigmatarchaeota archaeon]
MKKLRIAYEIKAALISFLITLIIFSIIKNFEFKKIEKFKVIKVIDGDTIVLENGEKVRLIGIDTPEIGEKCYLEAKNFLQKLIENKTIYLEIDGLNKDKYGRLLRHVYLNGSYVNLLMIKEGLAFYFPYKSKYSNILFKEEEMARKNKIGCLWNNI